MSDRTLIDRIWSSDDSLARAMRLGLTPLSLVYGAVVSARGAAFDAGIGVRQGPIPALSIGNVSVGGTGKTPFAAYVARRLADAGATPAIVLRGYGDDEPLVHTTINPDVPVIVDPDRRRGIADAAIQGADVAVLDDAFQHRRAHRVADIVLVAADGWVTPHLLPVGPFREPLSALRRADLVCVTRKSASDAEVEHVAAEVGRAAPAVAVAVVRLDAGELRSAVGNGTMPLSALSGRRALVISGIGDPTSFERQLAAAGADVEARRFPDHHAFDDEDASRLGLDAGRSDLVVCTLKDAVKLGPRWPRGAPPLWYVSQRVTVERGADALGDVLDRVLHARRTNGLAPARSD